MTRNYQMSSYSCL